MSEIGEIPSVALPQEHKQEHKKQLGKEKEQKHYRRLTKFLSLVSQESPESAEGIGAKATKIVLEALAAVRKKVHFWPEIMKQEGLRGSGGPYGIWSLEVDCAEPIATDKDRGQLVKGIVAKLHHAYLKNQKAIYKNDENDENAAEPSERLSYEDWLGKMAESSVSSDFGAYLTGKKGEKFAHRKGPQELMIVDSNGCFVRIKIRELINMADEEVGRLLLGEDSDRYKFQPLYEKSEKGYTPVYCCDREPPLLAVALDKEGEGLIPADPRIFCQVVIEPGPAWFTDQEGNELIIESARKVKFNFGHFQIDGIAGLRLVEEVMAKKIVEPEPPTEISFSDLEKIPLFLELYRALTKSEREIARFLGFVEIRQRVKIPRTGLIETAREKFSPALNAAAAWFRKKMGSTDGKEIERWSSVHSWTLAAGLASRAPFTVVVAPESKKSERLQVATAGIVGRPELNLFSEAVREFFQKSVRLEVNDINFLETLKSKLDRGRVEAKALLRALARSAVCLRADIIHAREGLGLIPFVWLITKGHLQRKLEETTKKIAESMNLVVAGNKGQVSSLGRVPPGVSFTTAFSKRFPIVLGRTTYENSWEEISFRMRVNSGWFLDAFGYALENDPDMRRKLLVKMNELKGMDKRERAELIKFLRENGGEDDKKDMIAGSLARLLRSLEEQNPDSEFGQFSSKLRKAAEAVAEESFRDIVRTAVLLSVLPALFDNEGELLDPERRLAEDQESQLNDLKKLLGLLAPL